MVFDLLTFMKEWQLTTFLSVFKSFRAVIKSTRELALDKESERIENNARATRNKTLKFLSILKNLLSKVGRKVTCCLRKEECPIFGASSKI